MQNLFLFVSFILNSLTYSNWSFLNNYPLFAVNPECSQCVFSRQCSASFIVPPLTTSLRLLKNVDKGNFLIDMLFTDILLPSHTPPTNLGNDFSHMQFLRVLSPFLFSLQFLTLIKD